MTAVLTLDATVVLLTPVVLTTVARLRVAARPHAYACTRLANSGSAMKLTVMGSGYQPGTQAWYDQSLAVDPANPQHVYLGLEELYETWNGGNKRHYNSSDCKA